MKVCIVGGVAGGASAAARLRRLDEKAQIILFEKGEFISYANCGLPYYIGGEIKEQDDLLVTSPQMLKNRFQIDVRVKSEVVKIDRQEKKITVEDHATGKVYEESYDKLLLSPGAAPKRPQLPGIDSEGLFSVRDVNNTLEIDAYLEKNGVTSAVVVGGGFIGLEMAENLRKRDLDVTIVEFEPQVMAPLDRELANLLHQELIKNGVSLKLSRGVTAFAKKDDGTIAVSLTDNSQVVAGVVILAMGVAPRSELAKEAGLSLGVGNSIAVDEYFRTSDPDIYAVGDAISVKSGVTGAEILLPLAGPANRQGRSAAENMIGRKVSNGKVVYGSSVVKVFDYTAACVGMNEKQLKKAGVSYLKTYIFPNSHASYYPGAKQLNMKLLFAQDGKILGAQAVGMELVEKQIDVIAAVMKLGGTVYDLEELELCYAPPFNSAKSPVNFLGFTAANILKGDMPVFYVEDIPKIDLDTAILLDVRTKGEVAAMGTIPGAVNIPVDSLRDHLDELPKGKEIYVTCQVGLRGNIASRILLQNGYRAYNLSGGFKLYQLMQMEF